MPRVELTAGTIEYEDTGGAGPTLVLLGGLVMDGSVWEPMVAELRENHRCVVPTLPLGAHRVPMRPDADLSLEGFADMVAELLERLELQDVTLVQNDHAAAIVLAGRRPERVGRLVISSCEAF
jgi:pimeloyl-ACP methyl ester carboxylesterase